MLEEGSLHLHASVADSTNDRAAQRAGADATMSTTSLFERTSQIWKVLNQTSDS